jgi:hypothetical protein
MRSLIHLLLFFIIYFSSYSDSTSPPNIGNDDTTSHSFNWVLDTLQDSDTWQIIMSMYLSPAQ